MVNYTNQTRKDNNICIYGIKNKRKKQKNIKPYNSNNSKILKKISVITQTNKQQRKTKPKQRRQNNKKKKLKPHQLLQTLSPPLTRTYTHKPSTIQTKEQPQQGNKQSNKHKHTYTTTTATITNIGQE